MAFKDGLTERCDIYDKGVGKDPDTFQEEEDRTILYSSIPCRLHMSGQSKQIQNSAGVQFGSDRQRILLVKAEHNGAEVGYQVIHNNQKYIIAEKKDVFGQSSSPHHSVYILDKEYNENES